MHVSHTRQMFLKHARKIMPDRHANALYINTTDPAYYEKLLRCNRHNVRALYYVGRKYEKQGYLQQAQEYYERAVSVDPHFEPAVGALILLRRKQEAERRRQFSLHMLHTLQAKKKKQKNLSLFRTMQAIMISYLIILLVVFGILLR